MTAGSPSPAHEEAATKAEGSPPALSSLVPDSHTHHSFHIQEIPEDQELVEEKQERSSSLRKKTDHSSDSGGGGGGGVTWDVSALAVGGKTNTMLESLRSEANRQYVEQMNIRYIFFDWTVSYKMWWGFTVFWSILTIFFETYQISFAPAGLGGDAGSFANVVGYMFSAVFFIDILIHFNLAFYNDNDELVYERKAIAEHYLQFWFWIDLLGVFPFYAVALGIAGEYGEDNNLTQWLELLRLFRLVRLYRIKQLFEVLQWSLKISLISLTLARNFMFALIWAHLGACVMFFIARQYDFDPDNTWIGGSDVLDESQFEKYLTSVYWSVVTFTTVGYGDFSPVNPAEQIFGMVFMLINMIVQAWFIGSITLLIVKSDEKTSEYRETIQVLNQYTKLHQFDTPFSKRLKTQLKLEYNSREFSDEFVLKEFPSSVRRRVLRRLYLPSLRKTSLMRGIRQQFVDAFLTTCNVEIFSPGEEILQRGSIASDLYLLVEGSVRLMPSYGRSATSGFDTEERGLGGAEESTVADSEAGGNLQSKSSQLYAGEFINEVGFFTETPQVETVRTSTICKTLTMTQSAYRQLAEDHPGSVGKILQNLLAKVERVAQEKGITLRQHLTTTLSVLKVGSEFEGSEDVIDEHDRNNEMKMEDGGEIDMCDMGNVDLHGTVASVQTHAAMTSIKELITMHINKQKDDHTTRFLFAASRGDIPTIRRMCDQGFDPNSCDYDSRTGLMVAAMKGNTDVVKKMLEYHANPNLVDMHGTSALLEATQHGHEDTSEVLMKFGARLMMEEHRAASMLCQAVFDGDILFLRRLLKSGIEVNAYDYDKRTAIHIASAEGNVAAIKVLVEYGADLYVRDRWENTIYDEAKATHAGQVLDYLDGLGWQKHLKANEGKDKKG